MHKQITKDELLSSPSTVGVVLLNVRDDIEIITKKLSRIFGEEFRDVIENFEYIKNGKTIDIILNQQLLKEDSTIQTKFIVLTSWFIELEIAKTIENYKETLM